MATLKIKSDLILLLRKLKNPWIWILFFRVAKIWQSGLPYLWRIWRYDFKIDVRWWAKYQLKLPCIQILWGNSSRIMHSQTPSVQPASCWNHSLILSPLCNSVWYGLCISSRVSLNTTPKNRSKAATSNGRSPLEMPPARVTCVGRSGITLKRR